VTLGYLEVDLPLVHPKENLMRAKISLEAGLIQEVRCTLRARISEPSQGLRTILMATDWMPRSPPP
jgi:hypothetical protein